MLFLRVLTLAIVTLGSVAYAQNMVPPKSVIVRGECLTKIPADRGSLILIVKQRNSNAGTAAQQAQDKYNKLIAKVRKLNLKEASLQTQSFIVNEEFDYNQGRQTSRGFVASMSLEVETSEPARLSEVLKISTEEKVEEIGALSTFPSSLVQKKARENCLEEAFQNAKQKAERLIKSSGQKLGPALSIQEVYRGSTVQPPPMLRAKAMMAMDAAAGAPGGEISSKDTEIAVFVDAQFEIR